MELYLHSPMCLHYVPKHKENSTFNTKSLYINSLLTVREEHTLGVYENREVTRIFGPKRDEVIGGWRKLHNEELHNLYCSPSIIRVIKSRKMTWQGM
jgi:hypothetical protein